jgi:hypothetical protein
MKKRTQEKVAKIFALVVILIMIFQVLLPLFNSGAIVGNAKTSVTATTQPVETNLQSAPAPVTTQVKTATVTPAAPTPPLLRQTPR